MPTGTNRESIYNETTKATNTVSSLDLIKQEVELLLSFKKYSLFFGNEMGLSPEKYLGLRNRTATFNLIKSELEALFYRYKRVRIKEIQMAFDDVESKITIDLTLTMNNYRQGEFNIAFDISN